MSSAMIRLKTIKYYDMSLLFSQIYEYNSKRGSSCWRCRRNWFQVLLRSHGLKSSVQSTFLWALINKNTLFPVTCEGFPMSIYSRLSSSLTLMRYWVIKTTRSYPFYYVLHRLANTMFMGVFLIKCDKLDMQSSSNFYWENCSDYRFGKRRSATSFQI